MARFLEPDLFKTSSDGCGSAAGGCGSASSASGGCGSAASSGLHRAFPSASSSLTSWHHHASLTCRSFILRTAK